MDAPRQPTVAEKNSLALARAIIPPTLRHGGADERTIEHTERTLSTLAPRALPVWRALQISLSQAARLQTGRPLHALSEERARQVVSGWEQHPILGTAIYAIASLYKTTHFDRRDLRGSLRRPLTPVAPEPERWHQQVFSADDEDTPEEIECDVVVVGTGAGGAVVGRHLSEQGHAVAFVEEGPLRTRGDFPGHFLGSMQHLYRAIPTVGSPSIVVTRGRLVGGSTAVNTGSTLLPPDWVMDRWCEDLNSGEFSRDALQQHFDTVYSRLQVERVSERIAGPIHTLLKAGAESLGWNLKLMPRNAPDCDGKGFCDNGCREGARRSTDISYLPGAMERSSMLLSQLRIDELIVEAGKVVGVSGHAVDREGNGKARRVQVRAQAVVLAMGALPTPHFLLGQRDKLSLPSAVGRHLTLHPSGATLGLFAQDMRSEEFVPQSCVIEDFLNEGLLLSTAMADNHMMPAMIPFVGQKLTERIDKLPQLGGAGFLAADLTEGRVRRSKGGKSIITYQPSKADAARFHRGHSLVAELLLAGGAEEVYPCMARSPVIKSSRDLAHFIEHPRPLSEQFLASFHPLGTCRMSKSAEDGVVDLNHQVHGVPGLFIADASTVRGPLGVNPQGTVMALSTRAASHIGSFVD